MLLSIFATLSLSQSAQNLNAQGYEFYKQKDYAQAVVKFEAATQANKKHALSHYNLACTLSLLRSAGKVCEFNAYKRTILELLAKSISLDERRRARMLVDPDLVSVKDTYQFYLLSKKGVRKPSDLRTLLVNISWFGPASGAFGPNPNIDFLEDGTVTLSEIDVGADQIKRTEKKGTFQVIKNEIKVQLNGTNYRGTLNSRGELVIEDLARFTDNPSECEA